VADCRDGFLGFVGGCDQFVGGGVFGEVEEESVALDFFGLVILFCLVCLFG